MKNDLRRSLAYDLVATDLDDYNSLLAFVVAHTIAPVRAAYGLPPPRPDEGQSYFIERTEHRAGQLLVQHWRRYRLDESLRVFDPVVRALLLFGWLFPDSVSVMESSESVLKRPGWSVLSDSMHILGRPHEAIANLVGGLLGVPSERPFWTGSGIHRPAPNPGALKDLADARALIDAAMRHIEEDPKTHLVDIGLRQIDTFVADELDEVVRRDVHRRFVWLGTYEWFDDDDDERASQALPEVFSKGVFGAEIPESIKGLIALDFSEQLRLDRSTARCAHCGSLMVLNARQKGRAGRGDPVYHEDCRDEHRLGYFRRKSRDRYARTRAVG